MYLYMKRYPFLIIVGRHGQRLSSIFEVRLNRFHISADADCWPDVFINCRDRHRNRAMRFANRGDLTP